MAVVNSHGKLNLQRLRLLFRLVVVLMAVNMAAIPFPVMAHALADAPAPAVILTANGPLTPIMVEYIGRGLFLAESQHAAVVIIQLDTPGGSLDLMDEIIQEMRGSSVPVVVYVSPSGAMAGSAGTIITVAAHVVAMAPDTTIGAASPVGSQGEDIGQTEATKIIEMYKAEVRTYTKDRPPEATKLAEDAIEFAKAATVQEALSVGLVDIQANNVADLLRQLDGRKVRMDDKEIILSTRDAPTVEVGNTFIEETLQLLTDPNIVFILLSVGVQAILIELSNPGGWVPGFVGVVALLLAVYGLGILPVNWFGLLFLVVAFVLFVLDIKAPTHGALTAAGVVSFIVGALVLFNSTRVPGFPPVSTPLVIGTGLVIGAGFFIAMTFAIRAQRTPLKTGTDLLQGKTGFVRSELNPGGQVQVDGEMWSALVSEDEAPLPVDTRVVVVSRDGLILKVRKA